MTCYYPDLSSASDWLKQISLAAQPIRSTTLTSAVTRHQYGISALVSQTSFREETSGGIAKCRLFYKARNVTESLEKSISCTAVGVRRFFKILTCISCIEI